MELLNDFHVHTVYSNHAHPTMTVPNILAAALDAGLKEIVVLEHIPPIGTPQPVTDWYAHRNRRDSLDLIQSQLTQCEDLFPSLKVWRGAEVDADPFKLDGSLMLEDASGLDLLLGSTHVLPGGASFWFDRSALTPEKSWEIATSWRDWTVQVIREKRIKVLAHPCDILGARSLTPPFDSRETRQLLEPLLQALVDCNVAFELNELLGSKIKNPYRSSYAFLVQRAREMGATFSIASDAHQPDRIGQFIWVRELIAGAQIEAKHLWQGPGAL